MKKYPYDTSFLVFPEHLNDLQPLIFGGAFFSEMDKTAAVCIRQFLKENGSVCANAVTHKFEGTFHKPCYLGDLICLYSDILSVGPKSIVVEVTAKRNHTLVAEAKFVFVSILDTDNLQSKPDLLPYHRHGIE